MPSGPIGDDELGPLFDRLSGYGTLIVAVSGGADSTALLVLLQRWAAGAARSGGPALVVATVDHGLRAESAAEAASVAALATRLGLAHRTCAWTGAKPASGLQDAARAARYALLAALAVDYDRPALVTAQHREDQAETTLMRLARGSGLDGLSGMRPTTPAQRGRMVPLERPLLDISKLRLIATLQAAGVAWSEDPGNHDLAFERTRWRAAAPALETLGLSSLQVARSARRLGRARDALEVLTSRLWPKVCDRHGGAFMSLDLAQYREQPAELQLRLLGCALAAFGDIGEPPALAQLEALHAAHQIEGFTGRSLAGALIETGAHETRIFREPGRLGLPEIGLAPGERGTWDNRFEVGLAPAHQATVTVRTLPPATASALRRQNPSLAAMPHRALTTIPAFWDGEILLAIPLLSRLWPGLAGLPAGNDTLCQTRFLWDVSPPGPTWT